MLRTLILTMLAACTGGCAPRESEVDKCTKAWVKAWEPFSNEQDRAAQEAFARHSCLKAASGKE